LILKYGRKVVPNNQSMKFLFSDLKATSKNPVTFRKTTHNVTKVQCHPVQLHQRRPSNYFHVNEVNHTNPRLNNIDNYSSLLTFMFAPRHCKIIKVPLTLTPSKDCTKHFKLKIFPPLQNSRTKQTFRRLMLQ